MNNPHNSEEKIQKEPSQNNRNANNNSLLDINISPIIKATQELFKTKIRQRLQEGAKIVEEQTQIALNHFRQLAPLLLETAEDIQYFKQAIVGLGYPPHEELDIIEIREISRFLRESKESNFEEIEVKEKIDKIMISYYDSEMITQISKKWEDCDHISSSLPILRNISMAHNLQLFNLSVPPAVALFEGIVMEVFEIEGKTSNVMLGELIKILLSDNSPYSFDEDLCKFYEDNVKVSFSIGKLVGSDISRHAILHGYDKEYGKETVSLKAILFLDQLIMASKSLSSEKKLKGQEVVASIRKDYLTLEELKEKGHIEIGHVGERLYLGTFNPKTKTLVYHKQNNGNRYTKKEKKIHIDEIVLFESLFQDWKESSIE